MGALTTENVLASLRTAEQTAAEAWAKAEKMKADMAAEGVNPLENTDAFNKLDDAYKAHGVAAQHVFDLKERLAKLQGWDNLAAPGAGGVPTPIGSPSSGQGPDTLFAMGARVTEHPRYKEAQARTAGMGDAQFQQAAKTNLFGEGLPVLNKRELMSILSPGRFGATTITGGSATSAGPFIQNDLQPGFVEYMRKTPALSQVVGRGETDSDVVEYVTQSAPTNTAAETAETNNSTESTYAYATATVNVQEFTHYVPATRRALQDAGQMRTLIENDLVIDLLDKVDDQIADGLGTGDEIEGIYTAVSQAQAKGGDNRADALHKALTKVRVAAGVLMEPDWIGVHPNDYQGAVLETDGTGQYLFGPPSLSGPRAAWGVPFLVSTVFTEGTPMVGNYQRGARLWVRSGVEVLTGLNDNDFVARRITLLATMRAAFKTIRPTAFCEVTGF